MHRIDLNECSTNVNATPAVNVMAVTNLVANQVAQQSAPKTISTGMHKGPTSDQVRVASESPKGHPSFPKAKGLAINATRVLFWLSCLSIEIAAYLVAPAWIYKDIPGLVDNLLSTTYSIKANIDTGPTMAVWDVSLYTGFNTTAAQNEVHLRALLDHINTTPLGSSAAIDVPITQIPFTMTLGRKANYLQSVTTTNQTDVDSARYTLLVGKTFSMGSPVFNPLESIVIQVRVTNRILGYETLRVLKTVGENASHESLVDATADYHDLVGVANYLICVTNYDANTIKCGSIVLPPAAVKSLTVDVQKTQGIRTSPPSCIHPKIKNMVYSIAAPDTATYYCAGDVTIANIRAFENWMVVTSIPGLAAQQMMSSVHYAPTGYRLPLKGVGFLDATPNATSVMTPAVQFANEMWRGQTSRIDYIIQTQVMILLVTRVASAVLYLGLLVKFSLVKRRNLLLVLVDNFSLEVSNMSSFDVTVAITLVTTYWTYWDMILAMLVRQCLAVLPWNSSPLHSYVDDLRFMPAPVCYIFVVGMCIIKHVLNTIRQCTKLAYVAVYLATVILLTGQLTSQGPALTAIRSVEPNEYRPTLVAPMIKYYYRTSPHLDVYFYMAYSVVGAIAIAVLVSKCIELGRRRILQQRIACGLSQTNDLLSRFSSFDVAVGLEIRFPGGFVDTTRMYLPSEHAAGRVRSTVYSVAMAGYLEIDGCLMPSTSVQRCVLAFLLGSSIDTSGPIHYFKLDDSGKTVRRKIYRTFPTEFIRGKNAWTLLSSLSLNELE
ncbi:Aste57867_2036 [Aphanomyces stellatus]|uniref:Aste57867_2036 protein n=1 Tax=Aphanomyces stellatus TaxID=120398 RepID=A0A485K6J3_9STRA|nr:hypothetical protein As57867_002032 [Aphanomyces stellatus]VFT79240.1 Aste57867_2036 [Aphanomyces stellatus]